MLRPRDGAEKDEGELTGRKRLVERVHERHGHFADVMVADVLYLNTPFINTVLKYKMDVVIRLKDEKRRIHQDAEGLFQKGKGKKEGFQRDWVDIVVWDLSGFEIDGCQEQLRVVKFQETMIHGHREGHRNVWLVTNNPVRTAAALMKNDAQTVGH